MKEYPILFSGEEVRAILAGRKTQMRRVIKPQPPSWVTMAGFDFFSGQNKIAFRGAHPEQGPGENFVPMRYHIGDRLWVRETFVLETWDNEISEDYGESPKYSDRPLFHHIPDEKNEFDEDYWLIPHYKATDLTPELFYEDMDEPTCKWLPSIQMPRWASRITLEIVGGRVQRVQEISYKDARAEGMPINYSGNYDFDYQKVGGYQANFRRIWDSLNAKRGYGWDVNPWVWVIEFKFLEVGK